MSLPRTPQISARGPGNLRLPPHKSILLQKKKTFKGRIPPAAGPGFTGFRYRSIPPGRSAPLQSLARQGTALLSGTHALYVRRGRASRQTRVRGHVLPRGEAFPS